MVAMGSGRKGSLRLSDKRRHSTEQRQSRSLRMLILIPLDRGIEARRAQGQALGRWRRLAMERLWEVLRNMELTALRIVLVVIFRVRGPPFVERRPCTGIYSDPAMLPLLLNANYDLPTRCCYHDDPAKSPKTSPTYSRRLRRSSPAQHGVHGAQCAAILGQQLLS